MEKEPRNYRNSQINDCLLKGVLTHPTLPRLGGADAQDPKGSQPVSTANIRPRPSRLWRLLFCHSTQRPATRSPTLALPRRKIRIPTNPVLH
jgi:hypothetical protein